MPQLTAMDLFHRKKKGFNPPLAVWLRDDLASPLQSLGGQLADLTGGQIDAVAVDRLLNGYRQGQEFLAEQVLQLLLLAMSLRQLRTLAQQP